MLIQNVVIEALGCLALKSYFLNTCFTIYSIVGYSIIKSEMVTVVYTCYYRFLALLLSLLRENLWIFDRKGWKFYLDFAYGKLWLLSVCFHILLLLSFLLTKPTSVGSPLYLQWLHSCERDICKDK